jgi:chemosensory pili system protein ChpA (sensor histidine kinase/response regulator)
VAAILDKQPTDDLSALAWVHNELRRSLETAHKALRRYLKEAETAARSDVDTVDPAALRTARTQLHQGVGALELVGLPAAARVLRASETAVQRMLARPTSVDEASVHTLERASFALLDYLARLLAGKPQSPVGLFPQYAAVQALAGADRVHPADLWESDFAWHEIEGDRSVRPRTADEAARGTMEAIVLRLMRRADSMAWTRLSDLCAELAVGDPGRGTTLWQLAAAFAEAEAAGLLPQGDLHTKRVAARLLAQLRLSARQQDEPSERLAQDLLFFCAHARESDKPTPRLDAVRRAWRLQSAGAVDYESERLGRFDPAWIAQARKRVAGAKDVWSAVAGGELHRLGGLTEQTLLLGDSVDRLFPAGQVLTKALVDTANRVQAEGGAPEAPLAMEVATAVLYLDATLEDGELDQPDLEGRIRRLAQRIDDLREGGEPQPLEPWMEELYRRVSDRQTMGSVVHELRASLSEVEKQIDQYFRTPAQRELLIPVPSQLSAMRGVLSVLGMDQASQAVLHMRDDVDALAGTEVDPQQAIKAGTFDRLADNLGALSFLIDMLSVQPQLAKSLFRFDPVEGSLSAVMGQSERASAFGGLEPASTSGAPLVDELRTLTDSVHTQPQVDHGPAFERLSQRALAADQPGVAGAVSSAQRALAQAPDAESRQAVSAELTQAIGQLIPTAPPPEPRPQPAPVQTTANDLDDDVEMREIFLEEAREVIAAATSSLEQLVESPEDVGELTTVRRAFHTLKGSSRMVGLRDYGDAAWACEQLYNARLSQSARMDGDLDAFTRDALHHLSLWTDAIADGRGAMHRSAPIVTAADSLRLNGQRLVIDSPALPSDAPLPVMSELATTDFPRGAPTPPAGVKEVDLPVLDMPAESGLPELPELPELNFELEVPGDVARPDSTETARALAEDVHVDLPDLESDDQADTKTDTRTNTRTGESGSTKGGPPEGVDAASALFARVPDLPLAADLELTPAPRDLGTVPAFELDLGDEVEAGAAPEAEPSTLDLSKQAASVPVPAIAPDLPDLGDVIEVDFGDFDQARSETEAATDDARSQDSGPHSDFGSTIDVEATQPLDLAEVTLTPDQVRANTAGMPDLDLSDLDGLTLDLSDVATLALRPAASGGTPPDAVADLDLSMLEAPQIDPATGLEDTGPDDSGLPEVEDLSDLPVAEAADAEGTADEAARDAGDRAEIEADNETEDEAESEAESDEPVKVIGSLRIPIPLFNIYLNEADELSRRLCTELAEWGIEHQRRRVPETSIVLAHSLAGSSATVGYTELSSLARALEHVLMRSSALGAGSPGEPALFNESAEEIRRLLHQFAAGFLKPMTPGLLERLAEHEMLLSQRGADGSSGDELPSGLEDVLEAAAQTSPTPLDEVPDLSDERGLAGASAADSLVDEGAGADPAPSMLAPLSLGPQFTTLGDLPDLPAATRVARTDAFDDDEDIDAVDALDEELFPIFEEEAEELLPQLQARLREWALAPSEDDAPAACMRTLHTFKGGARLAGAMRLGEMAHRLETAIEHLAGTPGLEPEQIEPLLARADAMQTVYQALSQPATAASAGTSATAAASAPTSPSAGAPAAEVRVAPKHAVPVDLPSSFGDLGDELGAAAQAATDHQAPSDASVDDATLARAVAGIDWRQFTGRRLEQAPALERSGSTAVRVRSGLLDRLVNHAGEVSITRARIDADVRQLQGAVNDLTDNLDRLRSQLRDIELQAESQITSRIEAAKAASVSFDPLEMDRFTRFQELTRMMAESVNDVATVQRSVQRTLQSTEDELAAQARLTRELQDDLLRTRMVEFESLADRLYRVVRQAAKDSGKSVRLDIVGGSIEVDRGVLERMIGPFEHLLRNSVAHGVESSEERKAAGKDGTGEIRITVTQEGNEIGVDCRDDGQGLHLDRIRARALERGLLSADQSPSEAELANMIFLPGFSTAGQVTELAGRGVGLDVVRAEVNAMGGRIETASTPGQGTSFKLVLPLTTAVTQVVMLRCGDLRVAVPSTLIEVVRRVPTDQVEQAYARGGFTIGDQELPFFWLGGLLQHSARGPGEGRTQALVVVRSAAQRVVVHVDEVLGNQEVVVKHVGPQLARLPGLAGVTLLPSGAVALIYNPVALAALYGDLAQRRAQGSLPGAPDKAAEAALAASQVPMVLVVDDSLTVRRVTQRLLTREGYRVVLAKDGMDALEKLAQERPAIMLSDIEMPRMDGFDLVRNVRADTRLVGLPVVMITSRIAQKHRDYAAELGVDHYLGKPYSEEELLQLVARYAGAGVAAAPQ